MSDAKTNIYRTDDGEGGCLEWRLLDHRLMSQAYRMMSVPRLHGDVFTNFVRQPKGGVRLFGLLITINRSPFRTRYNPIYKQKTILVSKGLRMRDVYNDVTRAKLMILNTTLNHGDSQ